MSAERGDPTPPGGLLLAAGAGSRMGRPKALVIGDDGLPWVARSVRALRDGGCTEVTVVLGAAAERARELVPDGVGVVEAPDWERGMSASLRAGLEALCDGAAAAALVHLVDLPDVGADVVRRVLAQGVNAGVSAQALARATYAGRPGHPVLIGRDHWPSILESVSGDEGARGYLRRAGTAAVECGDLAGGADVDSPGPGQGSPY